MSCSWASRAEDRPGTLSFTAPAARRLDTFLSSQSGLPRAQVKKLIEQGLVTVNGLPSRPSQELRPGDRVRLVLPTPPPPAPVPPLFLLYEDPDLLVVDKPPGVTVHPAPGHPSGTLMDALLARFPELAGLERAGLIHRLDKDTSGLLVVARSSAAWRHLSRQFKEREVQKGYLVLVRGRVAPEEGVIEAPILRHPHHRHKMAVVAGGREARTHYRVLRYLEGYTLLEAHPETGRTHQIRVHFSWVGHGVVGDPTYGVRSPLLSRQFLHAHTLRLHHPTTGDVLEFTSPLPPDLQQALKAFSATQGQ